MLARYATTVSEKAPIYSGRKRFSMASFKVGSHCSKSAATTLQVNGATLTDLHHLPALNPASVCTIIEPLRGEAPGLRAATFK